MSCDVSWVAKLGNICHGCNICVPEAKMFLTKFKNILLHQLDAKFASATMFLAWLNWETFACAAMFQQQCFLKFSQALKFKLLWPKR